VSGELGVGCDVDDSGEVDACSGAEAESGFEIEVEVEVKGSVTLTAAEGK
jgi:hypothetical protein